MIIRECKSAAKCKETVKPNVSMETQNQGDIASTSVCVCIIFLTLLAMRLLMSYIIVMWRANYTP